MHTLRLDKRSVSQAGRLCLWVKVRNALCQTQGMSWPCRKSAARGCDLYLGRVRRAGLARWPGYALRANTNITIKVSYPRPGRHQTGAVDEFISFSAPANHSPCPASRSPPPRAHASPVLSRCASASHTDRRACRQGSATSAGCGELAVGQRSAHARPCVTAPTRRVGGFVQRCAKRSRGSLCVDALPRSSVVGSPVWFRVSRGSRDGRPRSIVLCRHHSTTCGRICSLRRHA